MRYSVEPEEIIGKTATSVEMFGSESIWFVFDDGTEYELLHDQDCCESVWIEDCTGDLSDLVGQPISMSERVSNEEWNDDGRTTWTFWKFATVNGYVTVRWCGQSNGYYSEDAHLYQIEE